MTVAAVLPAASEVTMLYGGALASGALAGQIALFGHTFEPGLHAYIAVVITGVVGNTLGAVGGWLIGYYGGHPLLERYGRYIHVTPARIARAERWFARFQGVAVPLGFATPLVRSFVAIPAGILEVPLRRFVPLAIIGITILCAALARHRLGGRIQLGFGPPCARGTWTSWSGRVSSHWRSSGSSAGGARKRSPRVPDPSSPSRVSADRSCQWPRFRTSTSRLSTSRSFLS